MLWYLSYSPSVQSHHLVQLHIVFCRVCAVDFDRAAILLDGVTLKPELQSEALLLWLPIVPASLNIMLLGVLI